MAEKAEVKLVVKMGEKVYSLPIEKLPELIKGYGDEVEDKGVIDTILDWF